MSIDQQYIGLVRDILAHGVHKEDRTGTGTLSIFSAQISHNMQDGFPLLTTKKMYFKGIVTELLWFLRGDTNIKYLVDSNCNIWNGDAYKKYEETILKQREFQKKRAKEARKRGICLKLVKIELLSKEEFINKIKTDDEFAKKWGDLGPIYGRQWRNWNSGYEREYGYKGIDQIQQAIDTLRTNPDSRRIIVSAWNVGELNKMVLPPCHWAFELYTELLPSGKRRLNLKWHQRSVDVGLGLPFNIASYALLLQMIATEVDMEPGMLIGDLTNVHIYKNHIDGLVEQSSRQPMELPVVNITDADVLNASATVELTNYKSHGRINLPLSN